MSFFPSNISILVTDNLDSSSPAGALEALMRAIIRVLTRKFLGVQSEWQEMELMLKPHRETDTWVLSAVEDIQFLLDDHIVKTQSMRSSPFIKPIEQEVVSGARGSLGTFILRRTYPETWGWKGLKQKLLGLTGMYSSLQNSVHHHTANSQTNCYDLEKDLKVHRSFKIQLTSRTRLVVCLMRSSRGGRLQRRVADYLRVSRLHTSHSS